jgi:hypothetical protein
MGLRTQTNAYIGYVPHLAVQATAADEVMRTT